jgi:hypothetical protein
VHDAERAEERADAEPLPGAKQDGERREIEQRVSEQEQEVIPFGHRWRASRTVWGDNAASTPPAYTFTGLNIWGLRNPKDCR